LEAIGVRGPMTNTPDPSATVISDVRPPSLHPREVYTSDFGGATSEVVSRYRLPGTAASDFHRLTWNWIMEPFRDLGDDGEP
jgi:hypothetical protein